jgi:hypothetical protein
MQVTFEASEDELEQLAIMTYIAQYVVDSSGKFSEGYQYPNIKIFYAALRLLNKALLQQLPNTPLLEIDERSQNVFIHTIEAENDCEKILKAFSEDSYLDVVCTEITQRDYIEMGHSTNDVILGLDDVYTILYNNNMAELQKNGLSRFRLA